MGTAVEEPAFDSTSLTTRDEWAVGVGLLGAGHLALLGLSSVFPRYVFVVGPTSPLPAIARIGRAHV